MARSRPAILISQEGCAGTLKPSPVRRHPNLQQGAAGQQHPTDHRGLAGPRPAEQPRDAGVRGEAIASPPLARMKMQTEATEYWTTKLRAVGPAMPARLAIARTDRPTCAPRTVSSPIATKVLPVRQR